MKQVRDWVADDSALEVIGEFVRGIEKEIQEMAAGVAEAMESKHVDGRPLIRLQHAQALLGAVYRNPSVMLPARDEVKQIIAEADALVEAAGRAAVR